MESFPLSVSRLRKKGDKIKNRPGRDGFFIRHRYASAGELQSDSGMDRIKQNIINIIGCKLTETVGGAGAGIQTEIPAETHEHPGITAVEQAHVGGRNVTKAQIVTVKSHAAQDLKTQGPQIDLQTGSQQGCQPSSKDSIIKFNNVPNRLLE